MRIYTDVREAFKETARDVQEMGINVHPETMQDKKVGDDENFATKELQGYGFKIMDAQYNELEMREAINYLLNDEAETDNVILYIGQELEDRTCGRAMNPGRSFVHRRHVWEEFMDEESRFSYSYSERIAPQLFDTIDLLRNNPNSRQGIINIHSNLTGVANYLSDGSPTIMGTDFVNRGGNARIPCSMYYQFMIREEAVDIIYTMRSCDLLTHFPVDIALAMLMQRFVATELERTTGNLTYFAGSLHAYAKDMAKRGEF